MNKLTRITSVAILSASVAFGTIAPANAVPAKAPVSKIAKDVKTTSVKSVVKKGASTRKAPVRTNKSTLSPALKRAIVLSIIKAWIKSTTKR